MATTTSKLELSSTPLREWTPEAFTAEAKRTARLWNNHPAFNPAKEGLHNPRHNAK